MSRRTFLISAAALAAAACSNNPPADPAAKRREIDAGVDNAMAELNRYPDTRQLAERAAGVLVFPSVTTGGFVVGATYGQGALREHGRTTGYYSVGGGSVGLLAGAQTKTMYILFMTPEALREFQQSDGWTIGGNASVAVAEVGAEGRIDSETAKRSVIALVRNQSGFMANLSLDGTKFNRLNI
jgi:lipid-binding SYLF domain-containing protein